MDNSKKSRGSQACGRGQGTQFCEIYFQKFDLVLTVNTEEKIPVLSAGESEKESFFFFFNKESFLNTIAHSERILVGLPFPSPGIFQTQGSNTYLRHWQVGFLPLSHQRSLFS